MGISLKAYNSYNSYEFSCSFTLWDEIKIAYIQAFIYFLGIWIDNNTIKYNQWQDSNDYHSAKAYNSFKDITILYNGLINVSNNDFDNIIKLTNKYNEAIEEMIVFNGICDLLEIDVGNYLVPEQILSIIDITDKIDDFFNATLDKDIQNFKKFLGNAYSNDLSIIVS